MKVVLILANSADHDEMQQYAAFHLGLHCLPKYQFRGFQYALCLTPKHQKYLQRQLTKFFTKSGIQNRNLKKITFCFVLQF